MDHKLKQSIFILIIIASVILFYYAIAPVAIMIRAVINLISPFIIAFALAFIAYPLVGWLNQKGIPETVSKLLILVLIFGIAGLSISFLVPRIFNQFISVLEGVPNYVSDIDLWLRNAPWLPDDIYREININEIILANFGQTADMIGSGLTYLLDTIDFLVFMPILFVYFLFDYTRVREALKSYLKRRNYETMYQLLKEYEFALGKYVTGTLVIMVVMSVSAYLLFQLAGMKNALLFGVVIGITNLLPIVGNPLGGVIAMAFAFTESPTLALIVGLEVAFLTLIEGNIVTPLVQANAVKVHPLLIILGLIVFGYALGFFGVLAAIPLLLFVRLMVQYYSPHGEKYRKYKKKETAA